MKTSIIITVFTLVLNTSLWANPSSNEVDNRTKSYYYACDSDETITFPEAAKASIEQIIQENKKIIEDNTLESEVVIIPQELTTINLPSIEEQIKENLAIIEAQEIQVTVDILEPYVPVMQDIIKENNKIIGLE